MPNLRISLRLGQTEVLGNINEALLPPPQRDLMSYSKAFLWT